MTPDLATFAKVRTLHDGTAHPGERAAAAAKMQTLARRAGLTVAQALSKLDAPKPAAPTSPSQAAADAFNAFFNRPEAMAQRAEQDRQRQKRRAEILAHYGSAKAVYAETEREAALRVACEPMTVRDGRPDHAEDYTLDGWGLLTAREKVPPQVRDAVAGAWPLPRTVRGAWAEFIAAEEHERDRQTMHDYEHFPALWAEVRRYVLEDLLDTLPAADVADLRARLDWMQHVLDLRFSRDVHRDQACLTALRADIERLTPQPGCEAHTAWHTPSPVQTGHPHRTAADKRRDLAALLDQGLTDREIARRAGVSPSTVGAARRAQR